MRVKELMKVWDRGNLSPLLVVTTEEGLRDSNKTRLTVGVAMLNSMMDAIDGPKDLYCTIQEETNGAPRETAGKVYDILHEEVTNIVADKDCLYIIHNN